MAQPEVEKALTVTSDDTANRDRKYNIAPYDTLIKLPSISTKNVNQVADTSTSLRDMVSGGVDSLGETLGNKQYAQTMMTFLTTVYTPDNGDISNTVTSNKQTAKFRKAPQQKVSKR